MQTVRHLSNQTYFDVELEYEDGHVEHMSRINSLIGTRHEGQRPAYMTITALEDIYSFDFNHYAREFIYRDAVSALTMAASFSNRIRLKPLWFNNIVNKK